jgi:probable phosphoglycerate mutase
MSRLVLVRHGESNVTVQRVIGGLATCSGLSPLGRQQAERLRDRWTAHREFEPDLLVSSTYPRAMETADIVATAFPGLEVARVAGFGEHDPGPICDGLTYDEFVARFSPQAWQPDDPFVSTFPGGETIAAFHYRVGTALRTLLDEHPGRSVIVFCHGGVVDALLRQALRAPGTGGFQVFTRNTSITELEMVKSPPAPTTMWRLVRYNDAAHLNGLPPAT